MKLRSLIAIPMCAQVGWSAITLNMKDPKGQPIAGVSCSQSGATAVSDAQGVVTISGTIGILQQVQGKGNAPLFHLPVHAGEKVSLSVFDSRGQRVASREVRQGEQFDFTAANPGVYHIRAVGRNLSVNQSVVAMGKTLAFTGVAPTSQISMGGNLRKGAAAVEVVCSKAGYATKAYTVNDGDTKTIGFGMQIGRTFDRNAYPKYPGFNLEVAEDFNTADWAAGLTWDANFNSNDVVWEPSDGGFDDNKVRFQPSQVKFKDNALVMVMEQRRVEESISHSETDNCQPTGNINPRCPVFKAKGVDLASGEIRSKENAFRYGRYEITIDPPDAGTTPGSADGFVAAAFTWYTPRDRNWREIDIEVLGNKPSTFLTNLFFANNVFRWQPNIEKPNKETKPAGTFNPRAANKYAFEWLPGQVKWYVNDELVRTAGTGGEALGSLQVSKLGSKMVMNFWLLNADVGGIGANNQYPLEAKFDNFRYYRWDEDGDKVKYPETP